VESGAGASGAATKGCATEEEILGQLRASPAQPARIPSVPLSKSMFHGGPVVGLAQESRAAPGERDESPVSDL